MEENQVFTVDPLNNIVDYDIETKKSSTYSNGILSGILWGRE